MYSMFKSYEECLRYYTFNKSAPNHRSLTLMLYTRCVNLISMCEDLI